MNRKVYIGTIISKIEWDIYRLKAGGIMNDKMNRWGIVSLIIVLLAITAPATGSNGDDFDVPLNETESYFNQLILDIYVDKTGKTLHRKHRHHV